MQNSNQIKFKPKVVLVGQNGNVFNLLAICKRELQRNLMLEEAEKLQNEVFSAHSYDEALSKMHEYCDIC